MLKAVYFLFDIIGYTGLAAGATWKQWLPESVVFLSLGLEIGI
jgi:hypothetical protein